MQLKIRHSAACSIVLASVWLAACASPTPSGPGLPRGCIDEDDWPGIELVDAARLAEYEPPALSERSRARLQREDYLEAVCIGVNAYRASLGGNPELASFDVVAPWPALHATAKALHLQKRDHHGSDSWADHLGLAPFDDNSIKAKRRRVMNWLTIGMAQKWYDARGLGSPPD